VDKKEEDWLIRRAIEVSQERQGDQTLTKSLGEKETGEQQWASPQARRKGGRHLRE